MIHKGTKVLETERLILRKFKIEDAQNMFQNWASNPNVTKYLTWSPHSDVEITKLIIDEWLKGYAEDNYYQWAIEIKQLGQPIGSISVVRINEAVNEVEIGYGICKKYSGKGYATELLNAMTEFIISTFGINVLYGRVMRGNNTSVRVLEKNGYIFVEEEFGAEDDPYGNGMLVYKKEC